MDSPAVKLRTHGRVAYAIGKGKLLAQPCEVCGQQDAVAHHEDYGRPLGVTWLCPFHHRVRHAELLGKRPPTYVKNHPAEPGTRHKQRIWRMQYTCLRCGHVWVARKPETPKLCANQRCRSAYWATPKQEKKPRNGSV